MSLLRAGVQVSGLTLAGRALGYARTAAAAAVLGAGGTADAFFVALRLFGLLRAGLAAGGVREAFVPPFARRLSQPPSGNLPPPSSGELQRDPQERVAPPVIPANAGMMPGTAHGRPHDVIPADAGMMPGTTQGRPHDVVPANAGTILGTAHVRPHDRHSRERGNPVNTPHHENSQTSEDGPEAARRLAADAFVSVLAALVLAALVAALAMPWLVRVAAPGLAADAGSFDLAVTLGRVMLPCLVLGGPALVLCAMLNGAGRFAAAASMAVLFNLSALAGLFALGPALGSPAHGLAAGVAAAGAVQLAVLIPACRRAGLGFRPRLPRFGPEVRAPLWRTAPAAVSAGAMQALLLVDLGVATLLGPGAASHLDYAARVSGLGPALVGVAAATVLLPALARSDGRDGARTVNRTLEAVLLLAVPGAAALAAGAEPLAAALFRHGAFTHADAAATAQAMTAYAAGLPAWVAAATLASVLFARGEPGAAMGAALAAVAVNLGLSLALMGPLGHAGIALATAASAWLQVTVLLAVLVRRRAFAPDPRLAARLWSIAATGAATGLAVWLAREALGGGSGVAERVAVLAALGVAALAAFALTAAASGALRPRELAAAWKRR